MGPRRRGRVGRVPGGGGAVSGAGDQSAAWSGSQAATTCSIPGETGTAQRGQRQAAGGSSPAQIGHSHTPSG